MVVIRRAYLEKYTFICFEPEEGAPPVAPLPALDKGHLTFGAFNAFSKVSDKVLDVWSEVLRSVPESRLLIKSMSLGDASLQSDLKARFAERGIASERVEICGPTESRHDHLDMYGQVDIHLDTYPYHGTTTTCEAMWQGVPTLCLAGDAHRSRVGLSLLHSVGLSDWVAHSTDELINVAQKKVADLNALQSLRATLRDKMLDSPLTDGQSFVKDLEQAFDDMIDQRRAALS